MVDDGIRERLRAAMADESPIDLDEHVERVAEVVERARELRDLPTIDLFAAVRERSR